MFEKFDHRERYAVTTICKVILIISFIQTCNFSDGAKYFQLFGIQRWDLFKIISDKKKKNNDNVHLLTTTPYFKK